MELLPRQQVTAIPIMKILSRLVNFLQVQWLNTKQLLKKRLCVSVKSEDFIFSALSATNQDVLITSFVVVPAVKVTLVKVSFSLL